VHELGDSSVNLVVRPWVKTEDYWMTRWDLTRALKEGLESAGCSIPFPQRDVHLFEQKAG
jgi:small conductance mechanosensitive channel